MIIFFRVLTRILPPAGRHETELEYMELQSLFKFSPPGQPRAAAGALGRSVGYKMPQRLLHSHSIICQGPPTAPRDSDAP